MKKHNTLYEKDKKKKWFIVLTVVTVIYMVLYLLWRAIFTLPSIKEYGIVSFIFGIFLLVCEVIAALEAFVHYKDLSAGAEPIMPVVPFSKFPDVDIFIATHNEEADLLYNTINACTYLKYPDKKKVHIYVCDDGNRAEIKALAESFGVGYLGLADNKDAKAGNLNNALKHSSSPLIATFDADMIPSSDFLMETVPYFFLPKMICEDGKWRDRTEDEIDKDYKIGFIQTPQSFYNPDLFQYNLYSEKNVPNEQDYFFREVNVGRNKANSPIYAGSNTVISREALESVGGIATGTITEDFETGIRIEAKGYSCYAVDKLLAKGLAPNSITSLIKQRERWARGCIYSLKRVHLILNKDIPWRMKLSYLACRSYWGSYIRRFIYILSPILFVLFGIPAVVCDLKGLLIMWLPAYILYDVTLRTVTGSIRSSRWSNIIDTTLFPYLMLPVILETFGIRKKEFYVTAKTKNEDDVKKDRILMLPHLFLFIISLVAIAISIYQLISLKAYGGVVILYWLIVNGISLLMAIFFMMGRKSYRKYERFAGDVDAVITFDNEKHEAHTIDISEGGFSIEADEAVYLPYKEKKEMDVKLSNDKYSANVKAVVASVGSRTKEGYKYSMKITDMDEENKREYIEMVYDRVHTLPKKISVRSSIFGDIASNINKRAKRETHSNRKLARVDVDRAYPTLQNVSGFIYNYNFEYVKLRSIDDTPLPLTLDISIDDSVVMHALQEKEGLYKVMNINELNSSEKFAQIVKEWNSLD